MVRLQYPYVEKEPTIHGFRVYHGIMDTPFGLLPQIVEARREAVDHLLDQAQKWEVMGFYSNASYWHEESRITFLDVYRMEVELGLREEDDYLEQEIRRIVEQQSRSAAELPSEA